LKTIDVLLLDTEGGELGLLPMFLKDGLLNSDKITICLVFMEVGYFAFENSSFSFIVSSRNILLHGWSSYWPNVAGLFFRAT